MDLKIKDVAELLNVSETTVRRWVSGRKIPVYRLNKEYRFSREEIENWVMQHRVEIDSAPKIGQQQIYPLEREAKPGMQQFSLFRAVHNGGVFSQVPGSTKEEVIRHITEVVAPKLQLDSEVMAELLLDREKLMPTALGNGIAVPHGRDFVLGTSSDVVVIAFPECPLEYGALDGKPVHTLFFLFASSDKRHLHLLAKIAHLCSQKESLELLQEHPSKHKLLEFIKGWESQIR